MNRGGVLKRLLFMRSFLLIPLATFAWLETLAAADWPQYRGPQANGVTIESVRWPSSGLPKVLWKVPTRDGFSSFAVGSGQAFTLVGRDVEGATREVCIALNAANGQEMWAVPLDIAKYDASAQGNEGEASNSGGDGPRSTPAVDGGSVFVLSANLVLHCLDVQNGKVRWTKNLIRDHGAQNIKWKNAASPIVSNGLVLVAGGGAGQSLLAFDVREGRLAWKGENDAITHATPTLATIHGVPQVIFFTQSGLVSLEVKTGKLLWRYAFPFNISTAASPVVGGDIVYCSAGYNVGGGAAKVIKSGDRFSVRELWRTKGNEPVANHWSSPVYKDGHLYGMFSFKQYGSGPMKCVEISTGRVKWEKPGFGAGNLILAGSDLVALSDRGEVVIVAANPARYQEKHRADLLEGKCWSTPALADGKLFIRSTREGACVELK